MKYIRHEEQLPINLPKMKTWMTIKEKIDRYNTEAKTGHSLA